ncbi:hypothetical protein GCM10008956_08530 [Deinococcus arenae]|uniref:Uncharacterized protein n=1 Tax=Deinococcus arenae TaxID=1452751 RepID=A0A8H9GKB0_9DEIO|nr:hypothetical protein [Deinococcus arenae]AWT35480.1 hypothetical protein DM785_07855 [Deinococcus actinosclerus]GGM34440.1 hypothetical protein GCM10008956_08530 [Deinococcus arenae]
MSRLFRLALPGLTLLRPALRRAGSLGVALTLGAAGSVTLTFRESPSLPGPVALQGVAWDTAGRLHLCLDGRLLSVNAARPGGPAASPSAVALPGPCQGVTVSVDARQAAVLGDGRLDLIDLSTHSVTGTLLIPGLSGAGFTAEGTLLIGSPAGLERVTLPGLTRAALDRTPVTTLVVAPDGLRAVVGRGERTQLLDAGTLRVLSGSGCDGRCPPGAVQFSADGRSATVQAAQGVTALRDGFPATTVLRAAEPELAGPLSALPLRDNTALILRDGETQVRDLQTGHRETRRVVPGLRAAPAALTPEEHLLTLTGQGLTLSRLDLSGAQPLLTLPGVVSGGAVGSDGTLLTLTDGALRGPGGRGLASGVQEVAGAGRAAFTLRAGALAEVQGAALRPLPGQRGAAHLSLNHWGNHAATWNAQGFSVTAQKTGRVIVSAPGAYARVTVSPDATRAYLFPASGDPRVMLLASRKTFALPVQPGALYRDLQISGQGVFAYLRADGRTDLYLPGQRQPVATLGGGAPARFSPDSTMLALGTPTPGGWVVTLHDPASGRELARSAPLDGPPAFLAWSADSRSLHVGAGPLDGLGSVTTLTVTP